MLRTVCLCVAFLLLSNCGDNTAMDGDGAVPEEDADGLDGFGGTGPGTPTRLRLRVVDSRTREPVPAMVSVWERSPTGQGEKRLAFGVIEVDPGTPSMGATAREVGVGGALATWHGLLLWQGEAIVPVNVDWAVTAGKRNVGRNRVPFGQLRLVAARGTEYELAEARVELGPDQGVVTVELPLARAVDTTGYLAADMHVHSAPGSNDSMLPVAARLKTLVAAGIDVAVSADHDFNTDLTSAARALWGAAGEPPPLATINGNEASLGSRGPDARTIGHFNLFPVVPDGTKARNGAVVIPPGTAPTRMFELLRTVGAATGAVVQLNHARLGWGAYFDDPICAGWPDRANLPPCPVDIDLLEVLNGYLACGTEIEEALKDWYALLGFGRAITATGNSDSHGTSQILAGFPRTYVRVPDDRVEAFTSEGFMGALRSRRAIATTGPFLTMRAGDDVQEGGLLTSAARVVPVSLRMQAASWVVVEDVHLKVNGKTVKTWPVPKVAGATPLFEVMNEPVTVEGDAFITAEAWGKSPLHSFVVGEALQRSKGGCPPSPGAEPGMAPFALTNPIFVDADGDGRWKGQVLVP